MTRTQPPFAPGASTSAAPGGTAAESQTARSIVLVADSHVVLEGAGVPVRRILPSREARYDLVDPFLLLDEFRIESSGDGASFPPHPHRGFEIVTYFIAGSGKHVDSEGNAGVVYAGGLQRITAGRGMWHGEGSGDGPSGPVHGLQLWINLARAEKGIAPSYQAVTAEQIPERKVGDATVRVLVGEGSPTQLRTPSLYYDVQLPSGGQTALDVPDGYQGFAYVIDGEGAFGAGGRTVRAGQVAVLGPTGSLPVVAGNGGVRFVLCAGVPHREPVRWNGPYVD
ncbi:MAG: pirin family protein [Chloroflexi bacterium]|nr:pirin family protein [Chloroflexota bacterium]